MNKVYRKGAVLLALCVGLAFLPAFGMMEQAAAAQKAKSKTSGKAHLSKTSMSMIQGNSLKLKVKGLQKNAKTGKKPKVTWKSKNRRIAAVDKNGRVTAKGGGDTVITATVKYSKKKKSRLTCKVHVTRRTCHNARQVWNYVKTHGKYSDEHEEGYTYTVGQNPTLSIDSALGLSCLEFYYGSSKKTYPDYDTVYMDSQLMNNQFNNLVYVEVELGSKPKDVYTLCGRITAAYDGGTRGITFTSVKDRYWNEYTGFTREQLQAHKAEAVKSVGRAFRQFNTLTKKNTGFTMQQIGFTHWK